MKAATKKMVYSALLATLVCVVTMFANVPSPFKGNLNLGDCMVILCGSFLPLPYAFLAAGVGAALADFLSPYALYAPVTFFIKGIMACVVNYIYKKNGKTKSAAAAGAVIAETIMVAGYFIFECVLYGTKVSALNIPVNLLQGMVGALLGVALHRVFNKIFR